MAHTQRPTPEEGSASPPLPSPPRQANAPCCVNPHRPIQLASDLRARAGAQTREAEHPQIYDADQTNRGDQNHLTRRGRRRRRRRDGSSKQNRRSGTPPPPEQTNRKFLRSPFHRRGRPQRRPRRSAAGRPASGPPRRRLRWGGARPAAWPWGGQMERPPLSLSSSSSAFLSSRLLSSLLSPRRGGWLGLAWLGDHEMRPSFFFPLCFFIPFFHHPLQEDGVFSYKGLEFREIAGGVGLSEARSYISAPRGSYL